MNDSKKCCGHPHIEGITCDVKNCHYHGDENYCMAKQISVGPSSACSSSETVCATFIPKSGS